jgi:hypothetical protein
MVNLVNTTDLNTSVFVEILVSPLRILSILRKCCWRVKGPQGDTDPFLSSEFSLPCPIPKPGEHRKMAVVQD